MGYKERIQEMLPLYATREGLFVPAQPRDIRRAIDTVYKPFERRALSMVQQNTQAVRKELAAYREEAKRQGNSTSRPATCASYILEGLVLGEQRQARAHLTAGMMPDFVFWMDLSHGTLGVIGRVFQAESEIGKTHGVDAAVAEVIDTIEEWRGTPKEFGTKAEHFLGVKADAQDAAQLLIQDPSGFLLIDETVRQIKTRLDRPDRPPRILPYQVPEFVACGAVLAANAYKAVYPLSSQSNS